MTTIKTKYVRRFQPRITGPANMGLHNYVRLHADENVKDTEAANAILEACNDDDVVEAIDRYHKRKETSV